MYANIETVSTRKREGASRQMAQKRRSPMVECGRIPRVPYSQKRMPTLDKIMRAYTAHVSSTSLPPRQPLADEKSKLANPQTEKPKLGLESAYWLYCIEGLQIRRKQFRVNWLQRVRPFSWGLAIQSHTLRLASYAGNKA